MIGSTLRLRSALVCVALLTAGFGLGCGDDDGIPPELAQRQALLAESFIYTWVAPPPTSDDDCTTILTPGSDPLGDAAMIRTAVFHSVSWDVICLAPGTYEMGMNGATPTQGTVTITDKANLTVKGIGATMDDTILDYAGQTDSRGFDVTAPGFWIENMWIKNTKENGVEVKAANAENNPNVFRKLHVSWDRGPDPANGAYSIYPTRSEYVIVEFCEVSGARDAGLYIGQVEHGIIRYNNVYDNVAGLEVENSYNVEVISNTVNNNTGGILALQEPNLSRVTNDQVLIVSNHVYENNRANFATGGAVAAIPAGTGLMAFAGTNVEFRTNLVENNDTSGLLIVSNDAIALLSGSTPSYPAGYDPYPTYIYSNDNTFTDNALAIDPTILGVINLFANPPVAANAGIPVMWDGLMSGGTQVPAVTDPNICVGSENTPGVLIILPNAENGALDLACDLPELPSVSFP